MPTDDELVRRLTMGGLDPSMAALVAAKHGEQRIVKVDLVATNPQLGDGTLRVATLEPGEILLGYLLGVQEVFGTTLVATVTAPNAAAVPVTVVANTNDTINYGGEAPVVAPGTYSTAAALAAAVQAAIRAGGGGGEALTVTVTANLAGHLVFGNVPFGGGAGIDNGVAHGITRAVLGLTGQIAIPRTTPQLFVLPPAVVPGDGNELFSVEPIVVDVRQDSGLLSFTTEAGTVGESIPIGYRATTDPPMPLRAQLVDSDTLGPYATDGTGVAFLWLLISSVD